MALTPQQQQQLYSQWKQNSWSTDEFNGKLPGGINVGASGVLEDTRTPWENTVGQILNGGQQGAMPQQQQPSFDMSHMLAAFGPLLAQIQQGQDSRTFGHESSRNSNASANIQQGWGWDKPQAPGPHSWDPAYSGNSVNFTQPHAHPQHGMFTPPEFPAEQAPGGVTPWTQALMQPLPPNPGFGSPAYPGYQQKTEQQRKMLLGKSFGM